MWLPGHRCPGYAFRIGLLRLPLYLELGQMSKSQNANARCAHVTVLGSNASRSPSPRKLMASTVSKMNVPGKNHIQGSVSRW